MRDERERESEAKKMKLLRSISETIKKKIGSNTERRKERIWKKKKIIREKRHEKSRERKYFKEKNKGKGGWKIEERKNLTGENERCKEGMRLKNKWKIKKENDIKE